MILIFTSTLLITRVTRVELFSPVCGTEWREGKVKEEKEDLAHHNRKDSLGNFLNLTFSKSRYWRM